MRIADVLRNKGAEVATITPETSVADLLTELTVHNIGAMVVVTPDGLVGIVSERDVVRKLHEPVPTCSPVGRRHHDDGHRDLRAGSSRQHLTELMTEKRVRHIPVLVDGRLAGIVSIGDVVKTRMEELKTEQEQLQAYITQGRLRLRWTAGIAVQQAEKADVRELAQHWAARSSTTP